MRTVEEDRDLTGRLFPDLPIQTFEPLGGGRTFATYEVNGDRILQLPRSPGSEELLRTQLEILPELSRELSAPVPVPERTSLDPPAMLYRKLDGATADHAPDGIWPERLGRLLYDLHLVPPEYVGMRPVSPDAVRTRLRDTLPALRDVVVPLLEPDEITRVDALLARFLDDDGSWSFGCCLTHGDLGPDHVLVGPSGDLVGVLDWEETTVGDPAVDFAWWLEAMPEQGERALAAYGGAPDVGFRERARSLYALMPWYEIRHGLEVGDPRSVERGLAGTRARLP